MGVKAQLVPVPFLPAGPEPNMVQGRQAKYQKMPMAKIWVIWTSEV